MNVQWGFESRPPTGRSVRSCDRTTIVKNAMVSQCDTSGLRDEPSRIRGQAFPRYIAARLPL